MSLAATEIEPSIVGTRFANKIVVLPSIDSTNSELRRRDPDAPNGLVLIAEYQSAGRGRRGHEWISPAGQGLHLSLLWRTSQAIMPTRWTFAAAVAACDALRDVGATATEIKWPNDLLIRGKKVGGILVEMRSAAQQDQTVYLGLGVNVHTASDGFETADLPNAGSLHSRTPSGIVGGRAAVAGQFLRRLDHWIERLSDDQSWNELRNDWLQRSPSARDRRVQLFLDGEATGTGRSDGIEDDGGLIVIQDDGQRRVLRQVESVRFGE
jgi:BirA family biotin operon repressor/biotin-[acetyl-CoA-carboxylase] ligase